MPIKIKAIAHFTLTNEKTGKKTKGKTPVEIVTDFKKGSVRTVFKNPITIGNNETLELTKTEVQIK